MKLETACACTAVYCCGVTFGQKIKKAWSQRIYDRVILSFRKHIDISMHTSWKHCSQMHDDFLFPDEVLPCLTVPWGLCTQKQRRHLYPGRGFYWDGPFWNDNRLYKWSGGNHWLTLLFCSFLATVYFWYVMEKARLVLVKEKRALATALELGSHDSVTPVNSATKSAERVSNFVCNTCWLKCFFSKLICHEWCQFLSVFCFFCGNWWSICGCSNSPVRLSSGPMSSELR